MTQSASQPGVLDEGRREGATADENLGLTERDGKEPRGLRARKKAATMHRIQGVALELFAKHAFDSVSIEQVAQAAEVSPSTVYRYFGTKEGLVLHDEFDDRVLEVLAHTLAAGMGLAEAGAAALNEVWGGHFIRDEARTRIRVRMCFEVPAIQGALALAVNGQVDDIARVVAGSGRKTFPQARVLASAMVWGIIAVIRNWYDAGCSTDFRDEVLEVIGWLDTIDPAT